jgi:hypothetical protein
MDYNFSWPLVPVDSRLQLARNIAAVDVLREVGESVKDDAVLMYLVCCDNSGLKECVMSDLERSTHEDWHSAALNKKDTLLNIPTGLRKMTYDYGMAVLFHEVCALLYSGCDYGELYSPCDGWGTRIDALPKKVRDILDTANITNEAELIDHRPVIDSLRAVIINESLTITNDRRAKLAEYNHMAQTDIWRKYGFDAVTPKQANTICRLRSIARRVTGEFQLSRKLPNKFVWDALCNLIDVLLVLDYKNGYVAASNIFTVHEYAKMAEVGRERGCRYDEPFYGVRDQHNLRMSSVDHTVDLCSKMSPLASFMLGHNGRMNMLSMYNDEIDCLPMHHWDQKMIKHYLTSLFPATSSAVKMFVKYEIALERVKLRHLSEYARRHMEKTGQTRDCCPCGCDCAEDPCCG